MSDSEVNRFLEEHSMSVLSFADSDVSYAVPEPFAYIDGEIYFHFIYHDESLKMQFVETTETITLTIYDSETLESVIVRGDLEEVHEDKRLIAGAAVAEKADPVLIEVSPNVRLGESNEAFYQLNIDESTGRIFEPKEL